MSLSDANFSPTREKLFSRWKWRAEAIKRESAAYADMFTYPRNFHGYTVAQYDGAVGYDHIEAIYFVDPSELERRFDLEIEEDGK